MGWCFRSSSVAIFLQKKTCGRLFSFLCSFSLVETPRFRSDSHFLFGETPYCLVGTWYMFLPVLTIGLLRKTVWWFRLGDPFISWSYYTPLRGGNKESYFGV